jgi:hypothetical protein
MINHKAPHMRHMAEFVAKKEMVRKAGEVTTSYAKYKMLVDKAERNGLTNPEIIEELRKEADVIRLARHEGDDPFFKQGVENSKRSCLNAIELIISELENKNRKVVYEH